MRNVVVDDVIDGEVRIIDVVAEDVEEGDFVEDKSKDVFSEVWEYDVDGSLTVIYDFEDELTVEEVLINDVDIWISVVKDVCLADDMVAIKEVGSVDVEDE